MQNQKINIVYQKVSPQLKQLIGLLIVLNRTVDCVE